MQSIASLAADGMSSVKLASVEPNLTVHVLGEVGPRCLSRQFWNGNHEIAPTKYRAG